MREFRSRGSVRGAAGNGRPYREHFERPLEMSAIPPIATENGEALNARGETARYASEAIVLSASAQWLFLRDFPNDFSAWGSFSRKWSKLLRLPFSD